MAAARARRLTTSEREGRAGHRLSVVLSRRRPRLLQHVDLENLWLPGELDSDLVEHRHELLAKSSELLLGLPDLADLQVPFGPEQDVQLQSIRGPCPSLLHLVSHLIVLLAGQAGWLKTHENAHGELLLSRLCYFGGGRRSGQLPFVLSLAQLMPGRYHQALRLSNSRDVKVYSLFLVNSS
jgi:hypothetical protein